MAIKRPYVKRTKGWELKEHQATPEDVFLNRRELMKGSLASGAALGATIAMPGLALAKNDDPSAHLYPVKRNPKFKLDRELTPEHLNIKYNNFYEFGGTKSISDAAQALKIRPWSIKIDGMVEKPFRIGFDDLLAKMQLEERLYRHRCVEAWSMTVPWSGFRLADLVALAKPLSSAKYIAFETFFDPKIAPEQNPPTMPWSYKYPWPYKEGLTMAEANNDLAFMVTGAYGKSLHKQFGAPIRLHLPWKYGFKSIKSITRISFTDERPVSFWESVQAREYGFWANVNPRVPHPRWSQARERVLGKTGKVPTLLYNGYGEFVADLYKGMEGQKIFY